MEKNSQGFWRVPWEQAHWELWNEPPLDMSQLTPEIPFMASLWIRSGCDMKEVSPEVFQVGAHFKALIKAILVAPSRILEIFFSFHVSLPRCEGDSLLNHLWADQHAVHPGHIYYKGSWYRTPFIWNFLALYHRPNIKSSHEIWIEDSFGHFLGWKMPKMVNFAKNSNPNIWPMVWARTLIFWG